LNANGGFLDCAAIAFSEWYRGGLAVSCSAMVEK
jgi:hypothetical protein